MDKFIVKITPEAYSDLEAINDYIMNKLQEPQIAYEQFRLIVDELFSLDSMPNRNAPVRIQKYKDRNMRKLIVKNYVIIYEEYDADKIVMIRTIVHGSTDWQNRM